VVRRTTRIAIYAGSFLGLTAAYTLVYQWGMLRLEGESRTLIHSLEVVVQSMTTTGYGQDAPWATAEMTVLMMLVQLTGIAYIFIAIPLFVVPWLRDIVTGSAPESAPSNADHVVIIGDTDLCVPLVDELTARGTPHLIVEADREQANQYHERGLSVLHADPTADEIIEVADIEAAIAVVVGSTDDEYIQAVLRITDTTSDTPVVALIEHPERARYLRYAGVSEVLSPSHRLGKALGDKVRAIITTEFEPGGPAAETIRIREYAIATDSRLFGAPLSACRRLETTGATLLGAWVRGGLLTTLSTESQTDRTTRLLVAGTAADHEAVADIVGTAGRRYQPAERVVIVGAGLIGGIIAGVLERADIETVVVDREEGPIVDLVGDGTEETVLQSAGVETADALIVTLVDRDAIDTVLVARALDADLEIIAAAERQSHVDSLRIAGADYVLAVPSIAGRMVTLTVFEQAVMPLSDRLHITEIDSQRVDPQRLRDEQLRSEQIHEATGCRIVAVERDDGIETAVDTVRIGNAATEEASTDSTTSDQPSAGPVDRIIVAGTDREIEQFVDRYLDSNRPP